MSGYATVAGVHAIAVTFVGDPEHATAAAVGSGGDTDTVGSIVRAIVGTCCWFAALLRRWFKACGGRELEMAAIVEHCSRPEVS
jgi:ADP-ribosylglycohydrolase